MQGLPGYAAIKTDGPCPTGQESGLAELSSHMEIGCAAQDWTTVCEKSARLLRALRLYRGVTLVLGLPAKDERSSCGANYGDIVPSVKVPHRFLIRSNPGFDKHGRLCKSLDVYSNGFALSQRTSFEMTDQPLRDSRYIVRL
jgi:hypothetical protein